MAAHAGRVLHHEPAEDGEGAPHQRGGQKDGEGAHGDSRGVHPGGSQAERSGKSDEERADRIEQVRIDDPAQPDAQLQQCVESEGLVRGVGPAPEEPRAKRKASHERTQDDDLRLARATEE